MNCLECAEGDLVERPAIGVCTGCGAAVCADHSRRRQRRLVRTVAINRQAEGRMRVLIVGGSDAGISAGLAAREHAPETEVTLLVADRYPNFSICGIPYHVAGQVPDWRDLAHRTRQDLEAAGLRLRLEETAVAIDPAARTVTSRTTSGKVVQTGYDRLVIGTGAVPFRPPIDGLEMLGPGDGVHVLHTMTDTFALTCGVEGRAASSAMIVGAGYIGMEMAEALTERRLDVTVLEQLDQVLPNTLDLELARHIHAGLTARGQIQTGTAVKAIGRHDGRLWLDCSDGTVRGTDLVLVVTGDTETGRLLGAQLVGSLGAEIAKRVDVLATGIHHGITVEQVSDLDLSDTPPMGSPWDALQLAAQAWTRATCRPLVS